MRSIDSKQLVPSPEETALAKDVYTHLCKLRDANAEYRVQLVQNNADSEAYELPPVAIDVLLEALTQIADGNSITLTASNREITTQQAADFLNVSRPFLVNLLETGQIPFHKVGTHRRVRVADLQHYKQSIDKKRQESLAALAEQAQQLNMGY